MPMPPLTRGKTSELYGLNPTRIGIAGFRRVSFMASMSELLTSARRTVHKVPGSAVLQMVISFQWPTAPHALSVTPIGGLHAVRNMLHTSDMTAYSAGSGLRHQVLERIANDTQTVWTPGDFADLASREVIDKTLQRLNAAGELRRIDRGLYDRPTTNNLTGRPTVPDYRAVIRAVARRDKVRFVLDGMTAANEIGLTTAVPARIEVLGDARLKPIKLGDQEIHFKPAAASRLYWADRPAMRVVQALHWMKDVLNDPDERARVAGLLRRLFSDTVHGSAIRDDLREGISALPIWMQEFVRDLINRTREETA
jgi:hypothetical protein